MLSPDELVELFCFVSARDWDHLSRLSKQSHELCRSSTKFILRSWTSVSRRVFPDHLHELLHERRVLELYVILSEEPAKHFSAIDESHRSILDLAVELRMYCVAEWLVTRGFKSNIDAETMFHCIRNHDIRGATVLLNCGIPVDRFRSRDDGLNVLTCSVMYGSPALVDMYILRGCSIPDGILIQAILSRHSDYHVIDIVSLLLDKADCNPDSRSIMGVPVLHMAIGYSPFANQLIELLVSRGADVNKRSGSEGGGHTALDVAAKKRKRACYDTLVSRGAIHSILYGVEMGDVSIIHNHFNTTDGPSLDQVKYLICFAAALGRAESVKALIETRRVNLDEVFVRTDISPLHLAACRGHLSICKLLIKEGINVTARAMGGMDIHIYAANITGSPLWFNPAEYGPNGSLLPPAVRLKTAAELAREAGYDRIGRFLDLAMVENVIMRKDSFDSSSGFSSPRSRSASRSPAAQRTFEDSETSFILHEDQ